MNLLSKTLKLAVVAGLGLGLAALCFWTMEGLDRPAHANVVPRESVDIKPGSEPNSINLKSKGVIPVAILSSPDFDATFVDPVTVVFAGASPLRWAVEDVDGDGFLDLVLHYRTQETDIVPGDIEACVTGHLFDGVPIQGCDSVGTVPGA
jgi:hypothetical protein